MTALELTNPPLRDPKNEDALSNVASGAQLAVLGQEADIDGDGWERQALVDSCHEREHCERRLSVIPFL